MLTAAGARASSIADEISASVTQSTPQNPRSSNVSNLISAGFDLSERWMLTAGARVTLEGETTPRSGVPASFSNSGGTVADFYVGLDWDVTDNWTLGATVGLSPRSTILSNEAPAVRDDTGATADTSILLRTTSSTASFGLLAGYDTAGDSNLEWSFNAGLSLDRLETRQQIAGTFRSGSSVPISDLRRWCARRGSGCPSGLRLALEGTSGELRSAKLALGVTATVHADTDLTLLADYHGYADDPAGAGIFSVGTAGRAGANMPIAPLRYLVRPEVLHRFGDFSLKLWVERGEYVAGAGQGTSGIGLKGQYRFTRSFRMWASAGGRRDVDWEGLITRSGTFALGAAYRF